MEARFKKYRIRGVLRSGIALRAEVQEGTRQHPEVLYLDDEMHRETPSESDTSEYL